MKRHGALAPLSRDHHHALVVAQRLRRAADAASAAVAREAFLAYWRDDGQRHFREEEEVLLPAFAAYGDPELPIVARVLVDHVRIRRLVAQLADAEPDDADLAPAIEAMHALGRALAEHVRREERELFALIERTLPEAGLERLVALLA
ncbi:MAG: hemerythrin domain-containing protein [Solirubrobacteraceae bacterium]